MKKTFALLMFGCALSFGALSETVRLNFLGSCMDGGSSDEFCECVFRKVEGKYSQKQIDAIELKLRRGKSDLGYSEFVKNASTECDAALKSGKSLGALAVSEDNVTDQRLSAEELAVLQGLGIDSSFALGIVNALFESPEYRDLFVAECMLEILPYFGSAQSKKTCQCAYKKIASDGVVEKLLSSMENGEMNDSAAFEMILPCIPKTWTPEMEKMMMDSCETVASKSVCQCAIKDLESHFTLEKLLRQTFRNPEYIQGYMTGAVLRCKE